MAQIIPFDEFAVSTKTFIVYTNLVIDIKKIFEDDVLPITEYTILKKKRGRKKKQVEEDPNKDVKSGSFILVQYRDQYRGVKFKNSKKATSFFRNAMPIVMKVQDKLISFKVSKKGKFQVTGCKTNEQAEICVLVFFSFIKPHKGKYYTFSDNDESHLKVTFEPVMHNIDFSVGFQLDREKLDIFVNNQTTFTSLLETTIGYTGVNIKMLVSKEKLSAIRIDSKEFLEDGRVLTSDMSFDSFCEKFKTKKKKPNYNTFLVFQSGSVIMSGKTLSCMRDAYYDFFEIIKQCFSEKF